MQPNKTCDVIVTYCWNRVGYNILRSLSSKGLKVWAADTSKRNICSMSKFCAGSFEYPDPFTQEDAFISTLVEKVNLLKPKVLMPTHDEGIIIARHRNKFPDDLTISVEEAEKLVSLSNKGIATRLAKEAGVPTPRIFTGDDSIESFPVVFKPVIGNSAKGVFFPKSYQELKNLQNRYADVETLTEEWIGGSDVSVDCIRYGEYFQSSVYRALVTKTDGGGTTTQREIISMPELTEYAHRFLNYVDYNGICGIDFRVDPEKKRVAFIEINTRFTGGLATPIAAGLDYPYILYCLTTGTDFDMTQSARVGTKTKWILGDLITLVGRILCFKFPKNEMSKIMTFRGFDAFDDYRSDDKKAILGEMAYYLSKLVKNRKLNP